MGALIEWIEANRQLIVALILLAIFVLLNAVAYRHAYLMTHFAPSGPPPDDENLSLRQKLAVLVRGLGMGRPLDLATPDSLGLAYEVHTLPGEVGPLEAWYIPHADSRGVVVMFHGYANSKSYILAEAKAIHDLGYSCFLLDFRGCGGSAGNATSVGFGEADDVARAVQYVRALLPGQPLSIFAQSMGAAAVLRAMAVQGVKADAVVLECPFDRLLTALKARFHAMGLPAFPGARMLLFWGSFQLRFNGFAHNPVVYARKATSPVLLLHGANDPRVSRRQVEAIFRNLPDGKQLHSFEGIGHESYVAKRPDEWKEWVGKFLARSVQSIGSEK
jgi:alpha-beta hydrolase superfamily lysophospholipase